MEPILQIEASAAITADLSALGVRFDSDGHIEVPLESRPRILAALLQKANAYRKRHDETWRIYARVAAVVEANLGARILVLDETVPVDEPVAIDASSRW